MKCPIIGRNSGNSDFNDFKVSELLTELNRQFGHAVVFIADTSAKSNACPLYEKVKSKPLGFFFLLLPQSRITTNARFA